MKKTFKYLAMCAAVAVAGGTLQSCDDDDDYYYYGYGMPNALVTVKQIPESDGFYMQLDEKTTLLPVNMAKSPFDNKEVRALVNYRLADGDPGDYDKAVFVNWIDSIRTKTTVPDMGEDNADKYGNDPVEIVRDWVTIAEDGYLTLRFRTKWGNGTTHTVNLVSGVNPDDPYEVLFCHDADGDIRGYWGDGLVAFRLDKLPDTGGKTVDLTLRWNSFSGEKSVKFKYNSGKATGDGAEALTGASYMKNIQ